MVTNQPAKSTLEAFPCVQSIPKPSQVINDDAIPVTPPGYGDNNKASLKASGPKAPDPVQRDTTT